MRKFAHIFYRNAINIGLPVVVVPEATKVLKEGALLEIEPSTGIIQDLMNQKIYQGEAFPAFMLEILNCGGAIPYVQEKVKHNV